RVWFALVLLCRVAASFNKAINTMLITFGIFGMDFGVLCWFIGEHLIVGVMFLGENLEAQNI
ncbi:hypothetical protein AB6C48_25150, partial [Vibrio splendidus]